MQDAIKAWQADLSSGRSGKHHNSIQIEQIMLEKALNKRSKLMRSLKILPSSCIALTNSEFGATFDIQYAVVD